jgi:hypothetical protein
MWGSIVGVHLEVLMAAETVIKTIHTLTFKHQVCVIILSGTLENEITFRNKN